jgi:hypothetical protein
MANVRITDLPPYSDPDPGDVLPIVDLANNVTKKVPVSALTGNVDTSGIAVNAAAIAVNAANIATNTANIATNTGSIAGLLSRLNKLQYENCIYVALNGSDLTGTGAVDSPLRTVRAAAAAAQPGDVVFIAPGTYVEPILPIRWKYDVTVFGAGLRSTIVQPAAGQEFNDVFKVDSGFWCWGISFAGHQADETRQAWAISFDDLADNTARGASGIGAYILKSPYIQNCTSITAEDDAGTAGSVSTGNTGGGILVDGAKCALNTPIRSMVVDSYTQVNLGGAGCLVINDGYAQLVSFFGTFCTYHVRTESGGQVNLSGGGTTDFGIYGLMADGYSPSPLYTGDARVAAYGALRLEKVVTIDVSADVFTSVAHGLAVNDRLQFSATQGDLPTGLETNTNYYVIASGLTADAFKVSATLGGAALDMSGTATGTYQFLRQGDTELDVISFTSNRLGTASRPNAGQLMFPQLVFPRNATTELPEAKTFAYTRISDYVLTYTEAAAPNGPEHEYVSGGTAVIGGTNYGVAGAVYDKDTGVVTLTTTTVLPAGNGNVTVSGLVFICPTSAYVVTSSIPIDASGNPVANDSPSRAGYRVVFYSGVNGGLKDAITVGQKLDFRNRSQISAPSHTFEFVGSGTNYSALPWNGGVPVPANAIVETNNGRVYSSNTNEKGDFAVGSQFTVDGTTGSVTINTDEFNLSGLNFIGPFSRNGGISSVGVQLREVSNNTSLIASTGAPDGNTVPTQFAVKAYADDAFLQDVTVTAGPLSVTDTSTQDGQGYWTRTRNITLAVGTTAGTVAAGDDPRFDAITPGDIGLGTTDTPQFAGLGLGTAAVAGWELTVNGGTCQLRSSVSAVSGVYSLDVQAANEFVTAATINAATTINLSNLNTIPTGYVWRGVLSFAYTSGVVSWFTSNSGYTVKWDGGTAPTLTANETESVVITVVGGGSTIEVAALQGRV